MLLDDLTVTRPLSIAPGVPVARPFRRPRQDRGQPVIAPPAPSVRLPLRIQVGRHFGQESALVWAALGSGTGVGQGGC
jgi:hypothetical protein